MIGTVLHPSFEGIIASRLPLRLGELSDNAKQILVVVAFAWIFAWIFRKDSNGFRMGLDRLRMDSYVCFDIS